MNNSNSSEHSQRLPKLNRQTRHMTQQQTRGRGGNIGRSNIVVVPSDSSVPQNIPHFHKEESDVPEYIVPEVAMDSQILERFPTLRQYAFNEPERILIVLDRVEDEVETPFVDARTAVPAALRKPASMNPRQAMIVALRLFVRNKLLLNKQHRFALMTLDGSSATWKLDFTGDLNRIENSLTALSEGYKTEDIFPLNCVFDVIYARCGVAQILNPTLGAREPPLRMVLCYGRTFTLPELKRTDEISQLLMTPRFLVDVVMTYETSVGLADQIRERMINLLGSERSMYFGVGRDADKLYDAMAKLLMHPLNRRLNSATNVIAMEHSEQAAVQV